MNICFKDTYSRYGHPKLCRSFKEEKYEEENIDGSASDDKILVKFYKTIPIYDYPVTMHEKTKTEPILENMMMTTTTTKTAINMATKMTSTNLQRTSIPRLSPDLKSSVQNSIPCNLMFYAERVWLRANFKTVKTHLPNSMLALLYDQSLDALSSQESNVRVKANQFDIDATSITHTSDLFEWYEKYTSHWRHHSCEPISFDDFVVCAEKEFPGHIYRSENQNVVASYVSQRQIK
jgi:hypothetical protein